MKKVLIAIITILTMCLLLTGCDKAHNIQQNVVAQSNNFETYRKVTVINLRSDKILLEVEGYIAIKDSTPTELAIIIETGKNEYKMHYVYIDCEIVYLIEQLENTHTDPYHWEINIFAVIPEIHTN